MLIKYKVYKIRKIQQWPCTQGTNKDYLRLCDVAKRDFVINRQIRRGTIYKRRRRRRRRRKKKKSCEITVLVMGRQSHITSRLGRDCG